MNRKIVFGGIAALVLLLTLITGAGVALAAMAGDALTAPDPTASTSNSSPVVPTPASTAVAADPTATPTWSVVMSDHAPQAPKRLAAGASPSVSDDAIRAWAWSAPFANDDPQNTASWAQEVIIEVHCMAGKGWDYDPFDGGLAGVDPTSSEYLALSGDTGAGDAYRWQDAGCNGYAVHVTGNDDNN